MAATSETTDYDPRYDRAQTVDGAKARYVDDGTDYTLDAFERDVARILQEGEYPDADVTYDGVPFSPSPNNPNINTPALEGQEVYR